MAFGDVVTMNDQQRAAWLASVFDGETDLRDEVESLVASDRRAGHFLCFQETDPRNEWMHYERPPEIGGPYRIIRSIAEGGMGEVWLAERHDGAFATRFAVKLVKRGMDTTSLLRRFRLERQVLANLRHPNIARLHDGGASQDGRLYLVMDYVEGLPIDEYCDQKRLTIRARLDLFLTVCDAVQAAHRSMILHRDLKPGNILVSADGTVTLIDFGLAKLLSSHDSGAANLTTPSERFFTHDYASPEQVRGEPMTTACDVYSLGVVLYELLCGVRPTRAAECASDGKRLHLEHEPLKPSIRAGDAAPDVAARRSTDPRSLCRTLAGDLDTIALAALRAEPQRRYQTVDALADDIRRHIAGRPVRARADTLGYRAGKFIRRNRLSVSLGLAVLVSIIALAVSMTVQSIRIAHERRQAVESGRLATETQAFLENMLTSLTPEQARGRDTSLLRDILENAARRVETADNMQPRLKAHLHELIADVYIKLDDNDSAEHHAEAALAIRRSLGRADGDLARCLHLLARVTRNARRFADTERLCREALSIHQGIVGHAHPDVARALDMLATALFQNGSPQEAEKLYRQALEMRRHLLGESDALADSSNNLAGLLLDRGAFAEALTLFEDAVSLWKQHRGPDDRWIGVGLTNQAICLMQLRRWEAAEAKCREALLSIIEGRRHPHALWTRTLLGTIQMSRGHYAVAIDTFRAALDERLRVSERVDADVARLLVNLGTALTAYGDADSAAPLLERSVNIFRDEPGDVKLELGIAMRALAQCRLRQARPDEAESLLLGALDRHFPPQPGTEQEAAITLTALGSCYLAQYQFELAELYFQAALVLLQRDGVQLTVDAAAAEAAALRGLSEIRLRQGDLRAAQEFADQALSRLCADFEADHPDIAMTLETLARCRRAATRG